MTFTKGNGVIWLLLAAGWLFVSREGARRIALLSLGATLLLVLPYFLHQQYYSHHPQLSESSSFLHAFSMQLTHARSNPYASYFSCIRDDAALRLPYWSVNDNGITPQFVLKTGDKPVELRKVELCFY